MFTLTISLSFILIVFVNCVKFKYFEFFTSVKLSIYLNQIFFLADMMIMRRSKLKMLSEVKTIQVCRKRL